jgi:ABC-2 type transport system permease protein
MTNLKWGLRKAIALMSTYYAHMLEYRAEIFFWVLSGSLPIILMGVWMQAAKSGNFKLSAIDFARYFFAVFQVRQFTNIWVIWDFEREVIEGRLSLRLLQPLDPAWHHVARHLAEKVTRFPLAILLTVLFFWLYPQAFWIPSWQGFLLCLVAIALAFTLGFLIQYTFSMFAFWTERASAIQQFWFLFYIFLSGIVAPLEVFPASVRNAILWTPFPYLVHFPAALLVGLPVNLIHGGGVILGWIILFFLANRWLWRQGLKQYSGMGA